MGKFAEEVIFIGSGHTGVRIGAADNAKLKRVGAQIGLVAQAFTQCRAGIFVLQHLRLFIRAQSNIALIPGFKISKFIIWRQIWVGFAIPFDLGSFIDWFPACALAGIGGV